MISSRTVEDIAGKWQSELDTNLETGDMPILYMGMSPALVGELPAVLALQSLDEWRTDASVPLAIGGGTSVAWLMGLLHRRGEEVPARSPGAAVAYTGPDVATHAAALTVWDSRRSQFHARPGKLPPAFQPHFAPDVQAGASSTDALPFVVADVHASNGRDGWTAWAAVAVAIALFLISLIA
jgi:hypothetical protein